MYLTSLRQQRCYLITIFILCQQPFQRFVETGRVAYVADGSNRGKLVAIVDVIDQTRALVDGPESGVPRQELRLNQLHLTKFRIPFAHSARTKVVRKAWKDAEISKKWEESSWCKRVQNVAKRREMNDFDRFKLRRVRKHRNHLRTIAYRRLTNKKIKEGVFKKKTKEELVKIRADSAKARAGKKAKAGKK